MSNYCKHKETGELFVKTVALMETGDFVEAELPGAKVEAVEPVAPVEDEEAKPVRHHRAKK
jgi:hypothetical protein